VHHSLIRTTLICLPQPRHRGVSDGRRRLSASLSAVVVAAFEANCGECGGCGESDVPFPMSAERPSGGGGSSETVPG